MIDSRGEPYKKKVVKDMKSSAYKNEIEAYKKFLDEKLLPQRNFTKKLVEGINLEIED